MRRRARIDDTHAHAYTQRSTTDMVGIVARIMIIPVMITNYWIRQASEGSSFSSQTM
jgi:hypothetical protein